MTVRQRSSAVEWEPNSGYLALLHNDPLPDADRHSISFASEAGKAIDYYYVGGDSLDQVIAGYRQLTGKASMMPKWAYGFWQSRQRYETQDQALGVLREYRKRQFRSIISSGLENWPRISGLHCFAPLVPDPSDGDEPSNRAHCDFVWAILQGHPTIAIDAWSASTATWWLRGRLAPIPPTSRNLPRLIGAATRTHSTNRTIRGREFTHAVIVASARGFRPWWLDSEDPTFTPTSALRSASGAWARPRSALTILHSYGSSRGLYAISLVQTMSAGHLTRSGFPDPRAGASIWWAMCSRG